MTEQEICISLIIPVHNAAVYLPACLDSVAAQTHAAFSCILAENGSTDSSAAVCAAYAARDARFTLLCLPPCGVAAARAAGRAAATGAYLTFADADDVLHPELLAVLLHAAVSSGLPLAACGYDTFADTVPKNGTVPQEVSVLKAPRHLEALLRDHRVDFGLWNKLYAAELLPVCALDNGYHYNEDLLANWQAFCAAPGLAFCDFAGYHYRQHAASASHRPLTVQSVREQREIAAHIRAQAPASLRACADAFYYEKLVYLASMILRRRDSVCSAELDNLRAEIGHGLHEPALGRNPALPVPIRAAAFATVHCPGFCRAFYRCFLRDRQ
jgi:glycosyltransferase involved in cell wall biosynthesis